MTEIEFSRWLFELPAKQHSQSSPSGSTFLPCLGVPSKSHCENSIFSIFLESSHQVGMKNVAKCYKHFLGYFNALKTHGVGLKMQLSCLYEIYQNDLLHRCPFIILVKTTNGDDPFAQVPRMKVTWSLQFVIDKRDCLFDSCIRC